MNFKQFLVLIVVSCFLSNAYAKSKDVIKVLNHAKDVPELKKKQGYLMFYVNVDGIAPSIQFSKISTKKTDFILPDERISFTKDYFLDLKNVTKGFYFIPLFAGIYQITRINAPFYDLPYWLPTNKEAKWRFGVEENSINFIGEINIAKERGVNVIDVNLFNRVATYHEQILKEIALMPQSFPLKTKSGYRDDFFMELGK
jgi:hypothetical protein